MLCILMDYIHMGHKYKPWWNKPFPRHKVKGQGHKGHINFLQSGQEVSYRITNLHFLGFF